MKIVCVGMNYPLHNKELHFTLLNSEKPVIFMKPDSSILKNRRPFFIPDFSSQIEYEAELVVRICRLGKSIEARFAHRYWDALTVGIDFTARDMQSDFRSSGLPWELSKGFDGSAVIGDFVPKEQCAALEDLEFSLKQNGNCVQKACPKDMIFSVDRIIEYVSSFCTLKTGDLIFTGTPEGVGRVNVGDRLQGYLEERNVLDFHVR